MGGSDEWLEVTHSDAGLGVVQTESMSSEDSVSGAIRCRHRAGTAANMGNDPDEANGTDHNDVTCWTSSRQMSLRFRHTANPNADDDDGCEENRHDGNYDNTNTDGSADNNNTTGSADNNNTTGSAVGAIPVATRARVFADANGLGVLVESLSQAWDGDVVLKACLRIVIMLCGVLVIICCGPIFSSRIVPLPPSEYGFDPDLEPLTCHHLPRELKKYYQRDDIDEGDLSLVNAEDLNMEYYRNAVKALRSLWHRTALLTWRARCGERGHLPSAQELRIIRSQCTWTGSVILSAYTHTLKRDIQHLLAHARDRVPRILEHCELSIALLLDAVETAEVSPEVYSHAAEQKNRLLYPELLHLKDLTMDDTRVHSLRAIQAHKLWKLDKLNRSLNEGIIDLNRHSTLFAMLDMPIEDDRNDMDKPSRLWTQFLMANKELLAWEAKVLTSASRIEMDHGRIRDITTLSHLNSAFEYYTRCLLWSLEGSIVPEEVLPASRECMAAFARALKYFMSDMSLVGTCHNKFLMQSIMNRSWMRHGIYYENGKNYADAIAVVSTMDLLCDLGSDGGPDTISHHQVDVVFSRIHAMLMSTMETWLPLLRSDGVVPIFVVYPGGDLRYLRKHPRLCPLIPSCRAIVQDLENRNGLCQEQPCDAEGVIITSYKLALCKEILEFCAQGSESHSERTSYSESTAKSNDRESCQPSFEDWEDVSARLKDTLLRLGGQTDDIVNGLKAKSNAIMRTVKDEMKALAVNSNEIFEIVSKRGEKAADQAEDLLASFSGHVLSNAPRVKDMALQTTAVLTDKTKEAAEASIKVAKRAKSLASTYGKRLSAWTEKIYNQKS